MERTPEEIAAKINALGLWKVLAPYNWAVKPRDSLFPYFCTIIIEEKDPFVSTRLLILEGWQTLQNYVHYRVDPSYGFISSPIELPHYELLVLRSGELRLRRYDVGLRPYDVPADQRSRLGKILWEVYGVMLRAETDPQLPMRFFEDGAIFTRVECADGAWRDEPLAVPQGRAHVEKVVFPPDRVRRAADLPIAASDVIELDFRLLRNLQMNLGPIPRTIYALLGVDATGRVIIDDRVSIYPLEGLRGMWEAMPVAVLDNLIRLGKIPGEIRLVSPRLFRLVRPLCSELPFRLTLKDSLPALEAAYAGVKI